MKKKLHKTLKVDVNGKIKFKNKVYLPRYSIKRTEKIFKDHMTNFFKSKNYNGTIVDGYHTIMHSWPYFYWFYFFPRAAYPAFFENFNFKVDWKKYSINSKNFFLSEYFFLKTYNGNTLRLYLKYFIFYLLIIINWPLKKNKIWVFNDFRENYRFHFFKKNSTNDLFFFKYRFPGTKDLSLDINKAVCQYSQNINYSVNLWCWAFKMLKPKKIIMLDNLYNDSSILIAAKKLNIKTIGISHGPFYKCTKYLIGEKYLYNKKNLIFDKLYVWHEIFSKLLIENSFIYNKKNIFISGWLDDKKIKKIKKSKKQTKVILAAHEDVSDIISYVKLIKFYLKKDFKIIFKKRSDEKNYSYLMNLQNELKMVDDFSDKDYRECDFAIACKSSIVFNYFFRGIPVVIPKTGLNLLEDLNLNKNIFIFKKDLHINLWKKKVPVLIKPSTSSKFLKEFKL